MVENEDEARRVLENNTKQASEKHVGQ